MRKNANPNSTNLIPSGLVWKLGCFFSCLLSLFSNPLLAVEVSYSEESVVDSVRNNKEVQSKVNALYIEEGAFVYGMENITQYDPSAPVAQKDHKKKPQKSSEKKLKTTTKKKSSIPKKKQEFPVSKITTVVSTHPSDNSIREGKVYAKEGTITLNNTFKSAILTTTVDIADVFSKSTNSSYKHSFFYAGGYAGSQIFTRPPPFYSLLLI